MSAVLLSADSLAILQRTVNEVGRTKTHFMQDSRQPNLGMPMEFVAATGEAVDGTQPGKLYTYDVQSKGYVDLGVVIDIDIDPDE